MIDPEHIFCMVLGALVMLLLMMIAGPDYKRDCDTMGQFRVGEAVYVCHAADKK